MASRTEIERKLEELVQRLDASEEGAQALEHSLPDARILALHLTDLETDYWMELSGGQLGPLHPGPHEGAHIRIRTTSDELIDIIDGTVGGLFSAYVGGRLRVEASISDLLRLRKLM